MMQQDNIMVMLTTTALVLIVAMIDFRISNRNDGECDR
jgi:preprotein translocase subunit SecE